MFLDSERTDEDVLLLDIGRDLGNGIAQVSTIDQHLATEVKSFQVPAGQHIQ